MSLIFNQTMAVHRRRRVESVYSTEEGDGGYSWEDPEVIPVPFKVSIQPVSSTEDDRDRPRTETRYRLYTPPNHDLDLRSEDRVVLGGVLTMDVVGEVSRWPHPFKAGEVHHVEAELVVVNG